MTTSVKYFHSGMTGAPVMSGTIGAMLAVLDACLVDGFALKTVDSLVVSGGVATGTVSTGHSGEVDVVVTIAGAAPAGLNGEKRLTAIAGTTFAFDATGIADQTATGVITVKIAPAGWSKPFAAGNVSTYKPTDPAATGGVLRVDDSGTTDARVVAYESMSDINTGVGPFPTTAQQSGGTFWAKATSAGATARPWVLVADTRAFYLYVNFGASTAHFTMGFGDFVSNKPADAYACLVSGKTTSAALAAGQFTEDLALASNANSSAMWAMRGVTGVGSSMALGRGSLLPVATNNGAYSGGGSTYMGYPNPADNGLYVSPLVIPEFGGTFCYRGQLAGPWYSVQNVGAATFQTRDKVTGVTGLPGRKLLAVVNQAGPLFFDITGPWR